MRGAALVVAAQTVRLSAGYDIVLITHILAGVLGYGSVAVTWFNLSGLGSRLASGAPVSDQIRYFKPGRIWIERLTYLVPFLGFALVSMRNHPYSILGKFWVMVPFALWITTIGILQGFIWPLIARVQELVPEVGRSKDNREGGQSSVAESEVIAIAKRLRLPYGILEVLYLIAFVVMIVKP